MRPSPPRWSFAALLISLIATVAQAELIVVEVAPLAGGAEAGVRAGDRIHEWQKELTTNRIDDPLGFELLEIEHMPRGPLTLIGERDGETTRWELPSTAWEISVELSDEESSTAGQRSWRYLESARTLLGSGERDRAEAEWGLATQEAQGATPGTPAMLHLDWSDALEALGDRATARAIAEEGLVSLRESAPDRPLLEAQLLARVGVLARRLSDLDAAEDALGEALVLRQEHAPGSCPEAESYYDLHLCSFSRGDLDQANELGERSLSIYETLPASEVLVARVRSKLGRISLLRSEHEKARIQFESALEVFLRLDPKGRDVGESYTNLGMLARRSGDLALAEDRFLAALAIYEPLNPHGGAVAMLMNNLGAVAFDRGDLFAAEYYVGRALELREEREPSSMAVAMYLSNVAGLAFERGDLAKAELLYLRALAIREQLAPEGLDTALSQENLGSICFERNDLERSGEYFDRSLAMIREIAPGSTDEARILSNMGRLESRKGNLEKALALHEQSLTIRSELSPDGIDLASSLSGMADVNRQLGRYAIAQDQLEQAIAIGEKKAPGGLTVASYYAMLASVHLEAGDPERALTHAERSLELRQALIGGSYWEAIAWHDIGKIQQALGNRPAALEALVQATEMMDGQDARVGEIESSRIRFLARHSDMYRDCIDARVQLDDLEGAVEDMERSRARSFRTMLGQRDLQFTADLPADLRAERRRNRTEYDRALGELAGVSPTEDPETAKRLSEQLADLAEERGRIAAEVRRHSPQLDAIEQAPALTAREILHLIPKDTVVLSYSIGRQRSHVFVLQGPTDGGNGKISSFSLELPRGVLETQIRGFREAIQSRGAYESAAVDLYRRLIEPAADAIASARHVLVSPDGPLHLLPFAALMLPESMAPKRFLVEWRALHFSSSVAVYAELTRRSHASEDREIVVFADPPVPGATPSASDAPESLQISMNRGVYRSLAGGTRQLDRLEFAREEASVIQTLYGDTRTTLRLGPDASEAEAKGLSGKLAFAHFACHGMADQNDPLNSALILGESASSDSANENGFLQSWEILESLRFDADLVTLSACETALGVDMGGEGLVSLVRSFQYAGARSVLASLWQVADRPTSQLMGGFYAALRAGQGKDEALRSAQLESLGVAAEVHGASSTRGVGGLSEGGSSPAHPFYWAAFQLYGDPAASP